MSNMQNSARHAEVSGAGFAGLTAATALAQRGWTVRVHEKNDELREQGAGIVLWHNSLKVLEAMGALDDVMQNSMTPPYYETRMHHESVSKEDFGGLPWRTMTRPYLHQCLLKAARSAGVEIVTGSEVVSASPAGSLTLSSGAVLEADLVVGADGVKSPVRDSLGLKQERVKSRDGITRFLVPRLKEQLGAGEWDNVIDFWNLDPRYLRVLYVPCNDEELYLALGAPKEDKEGSRTPIDLDLWTSAYPELTPVLEAAAKAPDPKYYGYQTTMVEKWSDGRVAIVGDSAHAMCPSLAQGAGCAMQNAYTLAEAATNTALSDLPDALVEWDSLERPITERCQTRSADYAASRGMSKGNQFTNLNLETAMYDPTDPDRHAMTESK